MELDLDKVSAELVRALRGPRSQTAFARRLGYRSNAVYTWESGRRSPAASTFLVAARRAGVDLPAALATFLRGQPGWLSGVDPASGEGVAALLSDLRGDTPIGLVAARAGRTRFQVSRWLKGAAEPRLPDFLRMIEATSLRVLDFVALFADPAELPSTRAAWERLAAARTLAWSSPWAQAVLLALELVPYQALAAHEDTWLAARLHLPVEEVQRALSLLLAAGQIRYSGSHYAPVEVAAVDVRGSPAGTALKEFWLSVALERLRSGAPGLHSYNVFAVSEADLVRLEEMQRAHYRAIRSLVASSAPAERIALVALQTVPLG
jgi:transcriptional regulator with XRE-family HTH domain